MKKKWTKLHFMYLNMKIFHAIFEFSGSMVRVWRIREFENSPDPESGLPEPGPESGTRMFNDEHFLISSKLILRVSQLF